MKISCHNNQSTEATTIKISNFVDANAKDNLAKFIPITAYGETVFEYFFVNLTHRLPWQPIKLRCLD